jgi:16S rRNA (uracil1498-N3)-methyltransferase
MTRLILDYKIGDEKSVRLSGDELHYLVRVRRHKRGDAVELRDSSGRRFGARVALVGKDGATLEVVEELASAPTVRPVTIIVAPPKGNLMDDVIRKLSELGAERLIPAICERSVALPKEAKMERWQRIARESRRQCGRELPLRIDEPMSLESALQEGGKSDLKFILHPFAKAFPLAPEAGEKTGSICAAVGPEGGFTEAELASARSLGFEPAGFGSSIMRIETAALAAAVLCAAILGGLDAGR